MIPSAKDMQDALERIAMTPDGRLLYRLLQLELVHVPATTEHGALLATHGRRSLARDLKSAMDRALSQVETQSAGTGGQHDPDSLIVERRAEPVGLRAVRGTARRVEPYPDADKA